ncbi:proteoglycan 4-like [Dendronephthya gigantea]|uniref:proteoglycan 4-like n=1 Tax=Dendronephthya gigantea TaxID=151771 RepID=UPI00106C38B9|nr:proteoglycan 4-like [Dendronephthya gigantea]
MEEEEARLKALLEQTEDFDERRKIRADLRAVRKKMLDNAEAESNERAARRAERARARKAEDDTSNHTGPVITDKLLAELDDEETLQTLLNEIPTSQIEDRRRIRARIREVKRKRTEGEVSSSRRGRRTRETTETEDSAHYKRRCDETESNESSSVTMETTSIDDVISDDVIPDDAPPVSMETKSDERVDELTNSHELTNGDEPVNTDEIPNVDDTVTTDETGNADEGVNELTNELSGEPSVTTSDETSGVSIATHADEPEAVTIETSSAKDVENESDVKFKLTLRQSKDVHMKEDVEETVEQSPLDVEMDHAHEVPDEEPVQAEIDKDQPVIDGLEDETEDQVKEAVEDLIDDEIMNDNRGEPDEKLKSETEDEPVNVGEGISVELKIGEEVNLDIDRNDEETKEEDEAKEEDTPVADTADGGEISKDKKSNVSNVSDKGKDTPKEGSRWPPQNDEKKKHGRINQVDFRTNLKKSGKIGQSKGVVHLEKKPNTAGAQVDFRNLKKSGRIAGGGTVNLENKISTQGAQVDFRGSSLKPSGKLAAGVVHLERKTNTTGAQVDFRGTLKKGGSPSVKPSTPDERKGSLKSEKPEKVRQEPEEEAAEEIEPAEETAGNSEIDTGGSDEKESSEKQDTSPAPVKVTIPAPAAKTSPVKQPKPIPSKNEKISARKEKGPAGSTKETGRNTSEKDSEKEELPAQVDLKFDLKLDGKTRPAVNDKEVTPAPTPKEVTPVPEVKEVSPEPKADEVAPAPKETTSVPKETTPAPKETTTAPKDTHGVKGKFESKYKPRDSYKKREDVKIVSGGKNKLFDKMSKFQAKDETTVKPKGYIPGTRSSSQKKETAPAEKATVNGIAVKVENTSLTSKEPESPVQIEVTEHVEDDGETQSKVVEEKTTKQDGDIVEEKKEVTTTTKTTDGGNLTTKTTETKTTTKKSFVDPEMHKRMAQRQKERVMAKREQASSAKNKRMAFMQKLEANSPAQKAPSNIKRSGSNVDKLLAWCRFKLRSYEGVKLTNFSSSWADGLAFCALIHLYLPDKVPYEELLAAGDKRRNFEVAFGAASDAGIAELLEVDDMMSCSSPEPKSVMTYVSSIYKHFNPS